MPVIEYIAILSAMILGFAYIHPIWMIVPATILFLCSVYRCRHEYLWGYSLMRRENALEFAGIIAQSYLIASLACVAGYTLGYGVRWLGSIV